jgi:hypothetical protein
LKFVEGFSVGVKMRRSKANLRIEAAFEKAGILFLTDDQIAGIGVRLAKKSDHDYAKTTTSQVGLERFRIHRRKRWRRGCGYESCTRRRARQ